MNVTQLLNRLKNNIWMVEISVFMFAYSIFIELDDKDADVFYWSGSFGAEFFINNVGVLFFLTAIATLVAACREKTNLGVYLVTLGLTTLAAFSRIGAYSQGTVETSIWSIGIVWVHIVVLQMVLLFRYPVRDSRMAFRELLEEENAN